MYRLSAIVEELFTKYLPVAEKRKIEFNLDFPDTTRRVNHIFRIKKALEDNLPAAIKRANKSVSLSIKKDCLMIRDDGVSLSPEQLSKIENDFVKAKSRVGFGTEVRILFND